MGTDNSGDGQMGGKVEGWVEMSKGQGWRGGWGTSATVSIIIKK